MSLRTSLSDRPFNEVVNEAYEYYIALGYTEEETYKLMTPVFEVILSSLPLIARRIMYHLGSLGDNVDCYASDIHQVFINHTVKEISSYCTKLNEIKFIERKTGISVNGRAPYLYYVKSSKFKKWLRIKNNIE